MSKVVFSCLAYFNTWARECFAIYIALFSSAGIYSKANNSIEIILTFLFILTKATYHLRFIRERQTQEEKKQFCFTFAILIKIYALDFTGVLQKWGSSFSSFSWWVSCALCQMMNYGCKRSFPFRTNLSNR